MAMPDGLESLRIVLQRYRLAAGLSQERLAAHAELSRHVVSHLERGARRVPHPQTLRRVSAYGR
jgi:transcriptional regulator with XRE-family HTH domain